MSKTISEQKFKLDNFQTEAIEHIQNGESVIVCAPTGSGKTIIAKEAIRSALDQNKKVFYTAPLKALINQKYYEFSQDFGEKKVGIITGDTNKNRDAQIIVMTTEIYRNMLYGTSFGSIDPFLKDLKYIIFDEFHFINDPNRGTVWEESVVYTPQSVQIVALSATINNPEELTSWINEIHGKCKLVQTFERPVPLLHYYFKDQVLSPLLTTNGKLNPQLKERNDNRFGKNKGKFNNQFYNNPSNKTSIAAVIEELHKKDMLPGIYFVFSRKGCDRAVEDCEKLDLLTKQEKTSLKQEIDKAIALTPIIEKFGQLDNLRKGFAAHHAGLLPQVKSLIEELFAKGLIKVVFSTETLAAGINMPARSTIISNITKATDDGFRTLRSSEFLQMSGRAGRRGMDDAGYVITLKSGAYSAAEVAFLANSKPEDITSHFTSSYEMVLNLLQGHEYKEIKSLIEKSFGQYLVKTHLKDEEKDLKRLESQIEELQHPLCPGEIGDLNHYMEMQAKLDATRRHKKLLEKQMDPHIDELEASIEMLTMEAKSYPCNGCPKQKPCSKQMDKIKRYRKQAKELENKIENIQNMTWESFEKVLNLLKTENYIDDKFKASKKGETCASLRADNTYFMTELINSDLLKGISPNEFAAIISCFVIGEGRSKDKAFANQAKIVIEKERDLKNLARKVIQTQRSFSLDFSIDLNTTLSNIIYDWTSGKSWEEVTKSTTLDDGDILRGLRRTLDISKQISKAPNVSKEIQSLAIEAIRTLERDLVIEVV